MTRIHTNAQLIVDFMAERNLTKEQFCKECSIPKSCFDAFLRIDCYAEALYMLRVLRYTNININDLFVF